MRGALALGTLSELLFSTTEQRTDFTLNCDVVSELPMVVAFDCDLQDTTASYGSCTAIRWKLRDAPEPR